MCEVPSVCRFSSSSLPPQKSYVNHLVALQPTSGSARGPQVNVSVSLPWSASSGLHVSLCAQLCAAVEPWPGLLDQSRSTLERLKSPTAKIRRASASGFTLEFGRLSPRAELPFEALLAYRDCFRSQHPLVASKQLHKPPCEQCRLWDLAWPMSA